MMNVIWTPKAYSSMEQNIIYLRKHWPGFVLNDFLRDVDQSIKIIQAQPYSGSETTLRNVRKLLVVKQIYLFYEIDSTTIALLLFFNNYQNPKKLRKLLS